MCAARVAEERLLLPLCSLLCPHLLAHLLTNTGYPLFGGHYSAPAGLQPALSHRHPPPQSLHSRHCLSPRGSQRSFGNINRVVSHSRAQAEVAGTFLQPAGPCAPWPGVPPTALAAISSCPEPSSCDLQFLLVGMLFPLASAQRGLPILHTAPHNQLHGS